MSHFPQARRNQGRTCDVVVSEFLCLQELLLGQLTHQPLLRAAYVTIYPQGGLKNDQVLKALFSVCSVLAESKQGDLVRHSCKGARSYWPFTPAEASGTARVIMASRSWFIDYSLRLYGF